MYVLVRFPSVSPCRAPGLCVEDFPMRPMAEPVLRAARQEPPETTPDVLTYVVIQSSHNIKILHGHRDVDVERVLKHGGRSWSGAMLYKRGFLPVRTL